MLLLAGWMDFFSFRSFMFFCFYYEKGICILSAQLHWIINQNGYLVLKINTTCYVAINIKLSKIILMIEWCSDRQNDFFFVCLGFGLSCNSFCYIDFSLQLLNKLANDRIIDFVDTWRELVYWTVTMIIKLSYMNATKATQLSSFFPYLVVEQGPIFEN